MPHTSKVVCRIPFGWCAAYRSGGVPHTPIAKLEASERKVLMSRQPEPSTKLVKLERVPKDKRIRLYLRPNQPEFLSYQTGFASSNFE